MNKGFTRWDKAWLPLVVAAAGVLGYHGIFSHAQTNFVIESAGTLLAMIAQGALVYFVRNKGD